MVNRLVSAGADDFAHGRDPPNVGSASRGSTAIEEDNRMPEGFGIVDCRPDGTFSYRYDDYGWEARRG
jgi:hypothetical protein